MAITHGDLAAIASVVGRHVKTYVADALADALKSRDEEIASLKSRLAIVENREHKGVWDASTRYTRGQYVTFGGGQWHCNSASVGTRPGTSNAWQLAVKPGRDGKDLR